MGRIARAFVYVCVSDRVRQPRAGGGGGETLLASPPFPPSPARLPPATARRVRQSASQELSHTSIRRIDVGIGIVS